ncbi:BTAD domain-containing putative transcriptional regulator [Pseudonocardia sp. WMMC193]|uniref:BTAD domain-containing putative transcriptional regulator n=1 Tax=Pseudonocardia sp. WMMC193 TaxID=2911965 RepID=UPI001F46C911|nr:BTAD domain-containing putative transcriptional regulator [Pseudonocardia sp. WMMC193]MCF7549810.1 AAA family ATPase [Pseudonocardia sp. WMMC193]
MSLRFRLLGALEAVRDGDGPPADLGGPKQRAVLAVLALDAGRVVATDAIVEAVWGPDRPPRVTAGLQAYVSNLRRALRDGSGPAIVRRAPGYLLDVPAECTDVAAFRAGADAARAAVAAHDWAGAVAAADAALAVWRGPLLPELADAEWVRVAAAELDERRAELGEDLVTGLLGVGGVARAVGLARELQASDPLRERSCRLHVTALYRAGRTADALEALRAHVRVLADELGLEPSPALRALQTAVLNRDPAVDAWPGAARTPVAAAEPARSELVGRVRELEALRAATGWLVLTGPAGIGKTRLAEEVLRPHPDAVRVTCPDDDGVPPWWPIRTLVKALGGDPARVLTPPAGAEADDARYAVYEQVDALVGDATVVVDDVQWADPASLGLLTHLAAGPARLVLTVRDGPGGRDGRGGGDLDRLLAAAARRPGTRTLALGPLAETEVAELAERIGGEPLAADEVRALADHTGGNPFFVGEYARLPRADRLAGEVPGAVRTVLGRRLGALDDDVLRVLRAAAVTGDPLDLEVIGAITRLDLDEVVDLLDEAADAQIIVAAEGRYGFAHGLLRDEVLAGLSDVRRRRAHACAAGFTTGSRRAAHLVAALPLVDPAEVLDACRTAARDADARWDADSAARWWGAALDVFDQTGGGDTERDELLVARLGALARAGRGQTVLDVVDAALLAAVRHGRTRSAGLLAGTLLRTAGAWPWPTYGQDAEDGRAGSATGHGRLVSRLAGIERLVAGDPPAHARVLAALAVGSCYDRDESVPDVLSARAIEVAEKCGDAEALSDALLGRALVYSGVAGRAAESIALLERQDALRAGPPADDAVRHSLLLMARMTLGDTARAEEHVRQGIAASDLLRLPVDRAQLRWAEGMLTQWRGDLDAAEARFEHAYALHRRTELYQAGVYSLAVLTLRWEQGRLAELVGLPGVTTAPPSAAAAPDDRIVPLLCAAAAAGLGRSALAAQWVAAELARPEPTGWITHGRFTLLAHLVADLRLHPHVARVLEVLTPLTGLVATTGQVGVVGPVALATARLHLLRGDADRARADLAVAAALAERAGGVPSILRCRLLALQLDPDPAAARTLAADAEAAGLRGVAREAQTLAVP